MNNRVRIPSLEAYREVTNIGEEDVAYLEGDAIIRNPSLSPDKVRRVFAGGGIKLPLRTPIVGRMELIWFYKDIGHMPESEDEVRQLETHVRDVLPASADEPLTTPTLPARFYEEGSEEAPLATLTITRSMDVARERLLARHAICSFYELDEDPRSAWVDDDRAARVRLVRSKYRHSSRVLSSLEAAFRLGARLLPDETELGKVESHVSS